MLIENDKYKACKDKVHQYFLKPRSSLKQEERNQYDEAYAYIYECDGKHQQAASLYYNASFHRNSIEYLERAAINCLLAPPTQKRQAMLTTLSRDSRTRQLKLKDFLEKNLKQQILSEDEINQFCNEYQCQRNIFSEHQMIALSRFYKNISLSRVCQYINRDMKYVLNVLEGMIVENRLNARIDQVEGYLYINQENEDNIEQFCTELYNQQFN